MIGTSRAAARLLGLTQYQGAPCKRGHAGVRWVRNKACADCDRALRKVANLASERAARERARKAAFKRDDRITRPARYSDAAARYRRENSERIRVYERQRQAHPSSAAKALRRLRSAIRRGALGGLTYREQRLLYRLQGGRCAYCGAPAEHLDHMHPISRRGRHVLLNVQWLCAPCDLAKSATPDVEFRARRGIPAPTQWDAPAVLFKIQILL